MTVPALQGQAAKAQLRDRLRGKKPQTAEYQIVLDPAPLAALDQAERDLKFAEMTEAPEARQTELREAVELARADAADATETLHLHGLTRPAYEALLLAHPPTEDGKKDGAIYNVETFPAALVACCLVDPDLAVRPLSKTDVEALDKLTGDALRDAWTATGRPLLPDDVEELWGEWNQGEVGELFHRAIQVSTQTRNPSLPFGSGATRA